MKKIFNKVLLLVVLLLIVPFNIQAATSLSERLSGRILLQVEEHGEAWYVYPLNLRRYFLGRPADAGQVIRVLGLGVSNRDFDVWRGQAPARLAGRILLKVESQGQAYYVNPVDLKTVYLGTPDEAFNILKKFGLGVTNNSLSQISPEFNLVKPIESSVSAPEPVINNTVFKWNFRGRPYYVTLALQPKLYQSYVQSSKVYKYYGDLPVDWHEDYYQMFLTPKAGDNTIKSLATQFRAIASIDRMTEDGMIDLMMSFVQSIPYDTGKNLETGTPNYPYETLFTGLGVCSDKTFLAVMLLRELGYGSAVLDFPDVNHSAAGIQCPKEYSVRATGYCFAETTNYFPIGAIPRSLGQGSVLTNVGSDAFKGQFNNIFKSEQLGAIEVLQARTGKVYQGIMATTASVDSIINLEQEMNAILPSLNALKAQIDSALNEVQAIQMKMDNAEATADIDTYNALVPDYNAKIVAYNNLNNDYKLQSDNYNAKVVQYNQLVGDFYPNR